MRATGRLPNKLQVVNDTKVWKKKEIRGLEVVWQHVAGKNIRYPLVDVLRLDNRWIDNKKTCDFQSVSTFLPFRIYRCVRIVKRNAEAFRLQWHRVYFPFKVCPNFFFLGVRSLEDSCSLNYPAATFGAAWFQLLLSCVRDEPICGFWEPGPLPRQHLCG